MGYRTRLATLDYARSLSQAQARSRVVLVTGQSSFLTSRLSSDQRSFLESVSPPGAEPLLSGFPFHPDFHIDAPEPPLPAASVRNALQFIWSLSAPRFRKTAARALQPLFHNTREALYLITGSCGLQLLAGAWEHLQPSAGLAVTIVALGPAMLRPFALDPSRVRTIQGNGDFWSRALYRGPVTIRCECGHLAYWRSPQVKRLAAELLVQP